MVCVNKTIWYVWMCKQFIFMMETATNWVNEAHNHILKLYEEVFQAYIFKLIKCSYICILKKIWVFYFDREDTQEFFKK